MKTRFLFPYSWRRIGLALFLFGLLVSGVTYYFQAGIFEWQVGRRLAGKPDFDELGQDVMLLLLVCGLFIIAFTKEKIEDERIAQIRLDSLQWSIYFNYAILVICIICIDSWNLFLGVAAHYIFTPLVFFIIRFRWVVYQSDLEFKLED